MKKKKKPEIRFEGFTDDWEQRKLGDVYGSIGNAFVGTATPYYVEHGHFYLESNNIKDGKINHNSEIFINDEFYEKQKEKWLHTGDIVMVQSGHVGHAAVIPEELDNTAAHALIMFKNPKEKIEPYFLNYEYQTDKAKKKIENITTGNTIKHILASDMQEFEVDVPKCKEQKVIASYFCKLDHLITLHQRKYEKLKNVKKSMLEKMFPSKGCKVPEIRFSGFTDDWEQRKLLLICDFEKGRGLSKDNIDNNGKYPCILYGQLFTDYGMFINTVYSKSNIISEECKLSEKGDILIPRCDTTPDGLGRASVLALDNVILGFDINILKIKNKQKYDSGFVSVALNHHKKDLLSKVVGSTVRHLENKELRDVSIEYPNSLEEQKKVGEYFQALDHLITLHQRELEKLKNIKKTLLEKMF